MNHPSKNIKRDNFTGRRRHRRPHTALRPGSRLRCRAGARTRPARQLSARPDRTSQTHTPCTPTFRHVLRSGTSRSRCRPGARTARRSGPSCRPPGRSSRAPPGAARSQLVRTTHSTQKRFAAVRCGRCGLRRYRTSSANAYCVLWDIRHTSHACTSFRSTRHRLTPTN